jgi:molybdopterin-guanine dinucleotide biosynthesis protein A
MRSDVAVIILAGGDGRRIGGGKPLKMLGGERLIDRALELARNWSDLVAVAVRDSAQVAHAEAPTVRDRDLAGPLGGLLSGLDFAHRHRRAFLLTIPVDMPFLPRDLLDRARGSIGDRCCAVAASGGHLHPVCALWRSSAMAAAEAYAASGRHSLRGLAEQLGFATVEWPVERIDPFFNVNTNEDLTQAARAAY